jgi:hypothetical protein
MMLTFAAQRLQDFPDFRQRIREVEEAFGLYPPAH